MAVCLLTSLRPVSVVMVYSGPVAHERLRKNAWLLVFRKSSQTLLAVSIVDSGSILLARFPLYANRLGSTLVRLIVYTCLAWLTLAVILLITKHVLNRASNVWIFRMKDMLRASTFLVVRISGLTMTVYIRLFILVSRTCSLLSIRVVCLRVARLGRCMFGDDITWACSRTGVQARRNRLTLLMDMVLSALLRQFLVMRMQSGCRLFRRSPVRQVTPTFVLMVDELLLVKNICDSGPGDCVISLLVSWTFGLRAKLRNAERLSACVRWVTVLPTVGLPRLRMAIYSDENLLTHPWFRLLQSYMLLVWSTISGLLAGY